MSLSVVKHGDEFVQEEQILLLIYLQPKMATLMIIWGEMASNQRLDIVESSGWIQIVAIKVNPARRADFPGEYIFNINMYYTYQIGRLTFYWTDIEKLNSTYVHSAWCLVPRVELEWLLGCLIEPTFSGASTASPTGHGYTGEGEGA